MGPKRCWMSADSKPYFDLCFSFWNSNSKFPLLPLCLLPSFTWPAHRKGLLRAKPELITSDPKGIRHSFALQLGKIGPQACSAQVWVLWSKYFRLQSQLVAAGTQTSERAGYICWGFTKEVTLERCMATGQGAEVRTFLQMDQQEQSDIVRKLSK